MWKMHSIFVTINFYRLTITVILISIISEPTWIDGPHIPLSFALSDPFRQHLASTTALSDTKGKNTAFVCVFYAWHWTYQGQAIRRIRNWAIYHPTNPLRAQNWNTGHGILNIPLQPLQIVRIELEAEILWHRVFRGDPMGLTIAFIWAKVQSIFILSQVIG